jgi:hypothetical protein
MFPTPDRARETPEARRSPDISSTEERTMNRIDNFIIPQPGVGPRFANSLVLGGGARITETAGGLPELVGFAGETLLMPSGGNDTAALQAALTDAARVRLGPGTFTVSGTVTLAAGQTVAGSGADQTTVQSTHAGAVFSLASGAGVESLAVVGPGSGVAGSVAVRGVGVNDLRVRGLRMQALGRAVWLDNTRRVYLEQLVIRSIGGDAVSVTGGEHVMASGVDIDGAGGDGLAFRSLDAVSVRGVTVRNCARGLYLYQGNAHILQSIRFASCTHGITLNTTSAELAGVQAASCNTGFRIEACSALHMHACSTIYVPASPVVVDGGIGITISGFYSVMTGSTTPHLTVSGGATLVTVQSFRIVNDSAPPTWELDVAAAGGRVLFMQHGFAPTRINSGGFFAEV